ncbi:hypothetical protein JL721_5308 [Aureococcus anophagefferens]|nr:hypothetical protein JL721_5308 [Aureococcus anophagefferens]
MAEDDSSVALVALALQIEEPQLTEKMADYLSSAEGLAALCAFITLDGATIELPSSEPDAPADDASDGDAAPPDLALVRSFRAARLLAGGDGGRESLLPRVERHAALVARALFGVFAADARGCARHAVYVLDRLFRVYPDGVYDGLLGEEADGPPKALVNMVDYLGHASVARFFVELVAGNRPGAEDDDAFAAPREQPSAQTRWRFVSALSSLRLLALLAARAAEDGEPTTPLPEARHAGSAPRLAAARRRGSSARCSTSASTTTRARSCCRPWPTAASRPNSPPSSPTATTAAIPSRSTAGDDDGAARGLGRRARARRADVAAAAERRAAPGVAVRADAARVPRAAPGVGALDAACAAALDVNEAHAIELAVKHPGRQAGPPFTLLRLRLLEIARSCFRESGAPAVDAAPERFWAALCGWFFDAFPENAQFHRLFFALVSTALRCRGAAKARERLLASCDLPGRLAAALERRGSRFPHVLGLCDVLRLHAATLPPSASGSVLGATAPGRVRAAGSIREANATRRGGRRTSTPTPRCWRTSTSLENPLVAASEAAAGGASTSAGPGSPAALLGFEDEAPWSS